MKFVLDTIY